MENVESFAFWVGLRINRQMYLDEDTYAQKQREKGKKMKIKSSIETATALF
jgi:hypothetical protein